MTLPTRPAERRMDHASRLADRTRHLRTSAIREILKVTQEPNIISFAGGLPAPELFPVEDVRNATNTVLTKYGPAALQYSTTEGHLPLRKWIAERAKITPSHVQIVTGSQQGLDLLGRILINEDDVILVESPTYLGALQAFGLYGPRYMQLPTDEQGIDTEALAAVLRDHPVKFLYTIPTFQNPTGRTLSLERRKRLVELTAQYGVLIIEDDPYSALRFSGEALPSLYSLGLELAGQDPEQNHVIYCSSFSKTLMPGLRTAWVQAATPIIQKLIQAKQGADLHTPTLNQMVITELVQNTLPKQIEIVRHAYGERAKDMLARIGEYFPSEVQYTSPEGGMFLWVTLPQGIDTLELLARAIERSVAFVPGNPFFALGGGEHTMRLSYSSATPDQIDQGIRALGETIRVAIQK